MGIQQAQEAQKSQKLQEKDSQNIQTPKDIIEHNDSKRTIAPAESSHLDHKKNHNDSNVTQAKRVVFLFGPCGRDRWMWEIYQEMKKREPIKAHFITKRKNDIDFLASKGVGEESITQIVSFVASDTLDLEYIKRCEVKYNVNVWDLWNITLARKKERSKIPKDEVLRYFQHVFESIESLVDTFNPEYYVLYGVAGYNTALITKMFDHLGVNNLEIASSLLPNKFTFVRDLTNEWPLLTKYYKQISEDKTEFFTEIQNAKTYIDTFRNRPIVQDCMKKFSEPKTQKFKRYLRYSKQVLTYRKLPDNMRFVFWPIIQKCYDHMGIFENAPRTNDIDDTGNKGYAEKYVLFPLHFQPEATTLIFGKWYVDQATLIENIAHALPAEYVLYVKEHPYGYGNRNLSFYKRIKLLPNVRLISPHDDNFELIRNASLLTTITGTSGWEALLLNVPVITFGDIFFNGCSQTKKVLEIEQLPNIIRSQLASAVDEKEVELFVAALFKACYPGFARLPSDCKDTSLDPKNISLLVDGIFDYIGILGTKKK